METEAPKKVEKSDIIDAIVNTTDLKRGQARSALDAVLAALGDAIDEGADLKLMPFGKLKIAQRKDLPNGEVLKLRLRRNKTGA